MIIVEKPYLTIYWDENAQAVEFDWQTTDFTDDDYKEALNLGLAFMVKKGGKNMLSNATKFAFPSVEVEEWSVREWIPQALDQGYRNLAVVMPAEALQRMALHERATQASDKGLSMGYFDSMDKARAWLASVK